jgi:hypothetical protein
MDFIEIGSVTYNFQSKLVHIFLKEALTGLMFISRTQPFSLSFCACTIFKKY